MLQFFIKLKNLRARSFEQKMKYKKKVLILIFKKFQKVAIFRKVLEDLEISNSFWIIAMNVYMLYNWVIVQKILVWKDSKMEFVF